MRFGLLCSPQAHAAEPGRPRSGTRDGGDGFRDYLELNAAAEQLGYYSSFSVEHHFTGWNQASATLLLLAALAARTTRMRIGSAVIVLAWHNPVLLAEQVATLDLLSEGRFDFGIGKGYRHTEFTGFSIPQGEAEVRFEESLEILIKSWTARARFSHRGRFWHFENLVVEPPCFQQPHPPLWMAAGNPASIRRAAARGFSLILDQYASPESIGERIAIFKTELASRGQPFDPMRVAVARQVYVARDRAEAGRALEAQAAYTQRTVAAAQAPGSMEGSHVLAYAGRPGATEANALFGTAEEIARGIEALEKAGAEYLLLTISTREQLERFASDLMPRFLK